MSANRTYYKMKQSCPEWDSNPGPSAYEANALELINIDHLMVTAFYLFHYITRSSGGIVVKLLVCGARGPVLGVAARISEIGQLLFPNREIVKRSLKRRKILKTTNNQPTLDNDWMVILKDAST